MEMWTVRTMKRMRTMRVMMVSNIMAPSALWPFVGVFVKLGFSSADEDSSPVKGEKRKRDPEDEDDDDDDD